MTRTFRADYADKAFLRFCAKRDHEAKSKRGGRANGHPPKQNPLQISQNNRTDLSGQLSDAEFFANHKLAHFHLRSIGHDDDLGNAAAELLSIVVSRGGKKFFIPRVAQ